jgi:dolichol kinase
MQPADVHDLPSSELDALVARTAGPQPWRKAFHAFNALWVTGLISWLDLSKTLMVAVLAVLVAIMLAGDFVRLRVPAANELFFRAFGALASPREARGIASSTWYATGLLLTFALFPREVAISCVLVMGLGDPIAGYLGRRFGRRPFLGGTVEGTAVFFGVAAALMIARHPWPAALAAAAAATLAERKSWPLDDNLGVPLTCGVTLLAAQWLIAS